MLYHNIKKNIDQWLNSDLVSEADKQIIQTMNEAELARAFADTPLKFGTAGIRAITGPGTQRLNVFVYRQMALGYAHFLKQSSNKSQPVAVITHDNRLNGDLFALSCAEVLAAQGILVYLAPENKLLATPVISYWIRRLNADGGINITASHNPKAYNGFKAYNQFGSQVIDEQAQIIVQNMPSQDQLFDIEHAINSPLIQYLPSDCLQTYFDEVKKALPNFATRAKTSVKALYSSHHGVGSQTCLALMHQLGYINFQEFTPETNITGDFPDSEITNPEDPRSFAPMEVYANQHNINYLMSQDPDGDRFAMGERQKDNSFYYFNGNENGILFANYLLTTQQKPNRYVVTSYVTNNFIDRLVKAHQIPVHRTGTGFKFICDIVEKQEKANNNLLIAFEEAIGSLLFPFNREKDGYQSVALSLEMINYYQSQGLRLTDVLKNLYNQYGQWFGTTHSFVIKDPNWKQLMQAKLDFLENQPLKTVSSHPVTKVEWNHVNDCLDWILDDDNWLRFRLSGTEPKFKIYYNFFGETQEAIKNEITIIRQQIVDYLNLEEYL
ncbi:phosphomannomutase [Mycoplasmoides fastidiosum]|uniref:Phosphomannomutase n=1 Tax=Mycoplasmoides fastidiosum TaxID=92758 RepID=A0ABU0LYQ5_9BACT|nr:phospho-sugar mutase [Mycoplasmoides fastidiosum]MDQ0513847.1 phosphomannomutase [Mycoplasmoides fastidiosum]UUD37737.1 phospho-sugar mutase [Mycoplasmoides fastidiosum]